MKVMLDVNVLVDICGKTDEFEDSFAALDICLLRNDRPCMLACVASVIDYVVHSRKYLAKKDSVKALKGMTELLDVLDVTDADVGNAIRNPLGDFEDAVIAFASQRHGVDLILSRDRKGFKGSPVPVMSPHDFVLQFKPPDYDYSVECL